MRVIVAKEPPIKVIYLELIMLFERLHRLFLEVVGIELDRMSVKDLSNVQALVLYNIGVNQITVGEITTRGYYLGSNVSYNLKKMVDNGYIIQKTSPSDKRSVYVSLSTKGKQIYKKIEGVLEEHVKNLPHNHFSANTLKTFLSQSRQLETFLSQVLMHNVRVF